MIDNEIEKTTAKIIPFRVNNVNDDFYTIDDLINSPLAIYGIFWTIKNLLMHLSSNAAGGDDVTGDLTAYYNCSLPDKERYDIILIRHIHQLMANTITELSTYPDSSIDGMIAETMMRFRGN
jgi:hypothetical protein